MMDLAIIGGGPAGYVAAERAGAKGLNVVLFEKREFGGVCLNEGCIPTKTLLYSAKIYDTVRGGDKYGISATDVKYDFAKIIDRKNRVVRRLVGGVSAKMKANKVTVVNGEAYIKSRGKEGIEIECGGATYMAANLLICTGSEVFMPPIEGSDKAGDAILTSREILSLDKQPTSLAVIGGGVVGMEFASFFNSLGTKVTVIEMLPEILPGFDTEISAMLREIYSKKGVEFNLGCTVTGINGNEITYSDASGNKTLVIADKILMSVGRRAAMSGFGLENIGVELDRKGIKVDNRMRTNIPNVYAAGDVTGFSMLAHSASREAEVVVNNITGRKDIMRYDAVPSVVYTNPEVASVGLTAGQAAAEGIPYKELKLPMAYSGRFMAENEGGSGICKIIAGERGEILGVHMLGNPASEIIYGAAIAIEQEMSVRELEEIIFPHPTVSEILKETSFPF